MGLSIRNIVHASSIMDFTTQQLLQLPTESSADGIKVSSVVPGYDLSRTLLLPSCDKGCKVLSFGNITYAYCDTNLRPKSFTPGKHSRDAVQASLDVRFTAVSSASTA